MFEKLSGLYRPIAEVLKTSEDDLNSAFTPEIIGSGIEVLNDIALTDFGELVVSLLEAGVLLAASVFAPLTSYDKNMLVQIAGHLATRPIKALTPGKLSMAMGQAEAFGRSMATFDMRRMANTIFKSSYEVESTINQIRAQLESLLSSVKAPFASLVRAESAPSAAPAPAPAPRPTREPTIY